MSSIKIRASIAALLAGSAVQTGYAHATAASSRTELSDLARALLNNPKNKAWIDAGWNEPAEARKLSKSLIFDQASDHASYRPVPFVISEFPQSNQSPQQLIEKKPLLASVDASSKPKSNAFTPVYAPKPKAESPLLAAIPAIATPAAPPEKPAVVETKAPAIAVATNAPAQKQDPTPKVPVIEKVAVKQAKKKLDRPPRFALGDARLVVLSEDGLLGGEKAAPIEGAVVEWVGPGSGLRSRTDTNGTARIPYPLALSARFLVRAPGYVPATGYAVAGLDQPIVLIREDRLPAIIKSLGIVVEPNKRILLGKILDRQGRPVSGATVDANVTKPFRSYYSMGSFGLFHTAALSTGAQGDFLITGIDDGIQYLMPTVNLAKSLKDVSEESAAEGREWPAAIVDFSGLPQVVSVTVSERPASPMVSQVVDAFALERPDAPVHVTVGGQRGIHVPDDDGDLKIPDLSLRGSVDLVEVRSQGYLKTWLNSLPRSETFPTAISLFTWPQMERLFSRDTGMPNFSRGLVMGHLNDRYKKPADIGVYDGRGRRKADAKVFYFDGNNEIRSGLASTEISSQAFAVTNLGPGEWHLVVKDHKSGEGLSVQVIRVDSETVTQVEF